MHSNFIRNHYFVGMLAAVLMSTLTAHQQSAAYPLDGYAETNIGRLEAASRIEQGTLKGTKQPRGALLTRAQVDLRLLDKKGLELPQIDQKFSAQIKSLLGDKASRYGISVLDLSDLDNIRYAEHNGDQAQNPGSVGKLLVALGVFQALADIYPDDIEKRWQILRDTVITADEFIISDSHTVRMWDRDNEKLIRRPLKIGDKGTLFEYLDWMVSPSSNAAAATLTKHAMLIKHFGESYPTSIEVAD
ncbi:MAG: serine hydrolase, partial [Gammaproteobacteria bacterium]